MTDTKPAPGHVKDADTDAPLAEELRTRFSPRSFAPAPVPPATLRALLEAARWAPSCFNEQPWHFIVATRDDPHEYARMLDCLMPKNQQWAHTAPVLMLSVARLDFQSGAKPNRHALHDVGQAVAQLTVQARHMGLYVHQMAGFSQKKARETYAIPDGYEPVAAIALGTLGDPEALPDDFKQMETAPRTRRTLAEFTFTGAFGKPAPLTDDQTPTES